ncbi:hypothetical protein J2T56_003138 [Natronobacillus azotifigens]|uniref:DUF3169 family protein n=1 Tax=Natronobacillus azotifigens TaxID=472978 RepID=A0A9J6RHF9_9BACI|nr:DUF3169 family protein [Natronobacillus azotifigens]MCZ0704561.1 DUF3169 family protein [Natronobacillus azotifigens]
MKNKKDALKLLLIMLVGGIVGATSSTVLHALEIDRLSDLGPRLMEHLVVHSLWYQIGAVVIFFVPTLLWLYKAKKISVDDSEDIDLEEDPNNQLFDKYLYRGLLFNSVYFVIGFILFGLSADIRNPFFWSSIVVFLVFMFLSSYIEVKVVRSMQKADPMKKGEPTSMKFNKDFLESCDEAEKLQIYKSGYQSYAFTQTAIMIIFIIMFVSKLHFELGNLPILLVGGIWLLQLLSYFYYAAKNEKN